MDKRILYLVPVVIAMGLFSHPATAEIVMSIGNFKWNSDTAFNGILDHVNTAERTYTFPDLTGTITLTSGAQTLSSKSIDADTNTLTNIENADIKAGANVDAAKVGSGLVSTTEYNYLDGTTSAIQTQINTLNSAPKGAVGGSPNFLISQNGTKTQAINTTNGNIESSSTDDDVPIQYAINQLPSGGWVQLQEGTFTIDTSISITTDNLHLSGSGIGVTIIYQANGMNNSGIAVSSGADHITLNDFTIDGNGANNANANSDGILIFQADSVVVHDFELKNIYNIGVLVKQSSKTKISDCFVHDISSSDVNSHTGIEVHDKSHYTTIQRCHVKNIGGGIFGGYGILQANNVPSSQSNYTSIIDNTIENTFREAIDCAGGYGCRVIGNSINFTKDACIQMNVDGGVVQANTVNDCGNDGLLINKSNNTVVANNIIRNAAHKNNAYSGILISGPSSNLIVTSNRVFDTLTPKNTTSGIILSGTVTNYTITNNNLVGGFRTLAFVDSVSGTNKYIFGNLPISKVNNIVSGNIDMNTNNVTGISIFALATPTSKTISAGIVSGITQTFNRIDTEAAAGTDDLDFVLSGGYIGQILILSALDSTHTVVVKDGTGNFALAGDFSMDNREDTLICIYNNQGFWAELARSNNGA